MRREAVLKAGVAVASAAALLLTGVPQAQPVQAAGFTVNTTVDQIDAAPGNGVCATAAGKCSLRAAVMEANALNGSHSISLPAGLFLLTIGAANDDEEEALADDLDIKKTISIGGVGAGGTRIDGNLKFRVFEVQAGGALNLSNLTVQHAKCTCGGAIANRAKLALNHVVVTENETGGIYNGLGSQSSPNDPPPAATINNSTISKNKSTDVYAAAGINNFSATMTVQSSTISDNVSNDAGPDQISFGGFANDSDLEHPRLGGTLTIVNSTIRRNSGIFGGGVFSGIGSLTVRNSTVTENNASFSGGGFFLVSYLPQDESSPTAATAANGRFRRGGGAAVSQANGPISNPRLIENTLISGNQASEFYGGGVEIEIDFIEPAPIQLKGSTIKSNKAGFDGGGVDYFVASGLASDAKLVIGTTTITQNTADSNNDGDGNGGGVFQLGGTLVFNNSQVVRNTDLSGPASANNCSGTASCP
jgi:CSLREA domain-containing protein